ncbi:MAG: DUF3450 family protein, partial [Desulfobacterales bacterium]|nr:DUF3450 family protein [Desulfobacterales bacterium]
MWKTLLSSTVAVILGISIGIGAAAAQDISTSTVQKKTKQAIESEIEAQKQADEWSQEKEQLISEIRQNKTQLDWAKYQSEKYTAYIER